MREININELELYFESFGYPSEDLEVISGVYVLCENAEYFVSQTLVCLRSHPGNQRYRSHYDMLVKYYELARALNNKL